VDLLELIAETGSLRAAANRMEMSYMRAWTLVKSLNRCFREPLVEVSRGGKLGGGAKLTLAGRKVIGLYRRMEKESERAIKKSWSGLQRYLRASAGR
jgi:molybdate transport system regulatory protein